MFNQIYQDLKVFVTGSTGFKGSWLCLWLQMMGARVCGYALKPSLPMSHFKLLDLEIENHEGDIRDGNRLIEVMQQFQPEIVFHLAAQPLVRYSYIHPLETFQTNIIGTVHLFEACRKVSSVRAIVNVTSDKCYDNREIIWGYRETDPLGGHDPYSCSKGCAELITESYRKSFFFQPKDIAGNRCVPILASVRSGNVIGGGDWAADRLIPDMVRAAFEGKQLLIRNPQSVRPWQYVLEPLSGYLLLGQKLLEGKEMVGDAWNFGPDDGYFLSVRDVIEIANQYWNTQNIIFSDSKSDLPEANLLKLDSTKSRVKLNWKPVWDTESAIRRTTEWYHACYIQKEILTRAQIEDYIRDATIKRLGWVEK